MNVKPISESGKGIGCGALPIMLFGLVFFGAGSFFWWCCFLRPLVRSQTSGDWIETPCSIVSSKIDVSHGEDGDTYRPKIEFTYSVNGQQRRSESYDFTELNRSRARCQEIVDAYPVGRQTSCFYDPGDVETAVIERSFDFSFMGSLFPLIFIAVGLGIAGGPFLFGKKNREGSPSLTPPSVGAKPVDKPIGLHPEDAEDAVWDQPQKLKPATSRLFGFLFFAGVAAVWNGIVAIVGFQAIGGPGGNAEWMTILFLSVFAIVGIGMIGAAVYQLAALFNPTVELALSTGAVARGDSVDIAWELSGRTSSIRKLTISIQGKESATYRRGTSTITDTNLFCNMTVAEIDQQDEIRFGSRTAEIPVETMHSFETDRNKIIWQIVVAGDIRFWPDIKDSFGFRIKP